MATSASTPRIRITQVWYGIVLVLVALGERNGWSGVGVDVLGFLLMMTAALGRVWTSAHIAGHKDKRLITFGPYSLCRHPLYAFSMIGALGVGLVTHSLAITVATLAVMGILHLRAIQDEEALLANLHGDAFARYRERIPKLWPSWKHYELPTEAVLNVRIFGKAFVDASTFVFVYAAIQLLDAGRANGLWPTFFHLP